MSFKPVIVLSTHPRAAEHRNAREQVKNLCTEGQTSLTKAERWKERGTPLSRKAVIGLLGDRWLDKADKHLKNARTALEQRDILCETYGITPPEHAPATPPKGYVSRVTLSQTAEPQPGFTVVNSIVRINPMRTTPDTLKQDIANEIDHTLAKAHRCGKLARLAETLLMRPLAGYFNNRATDYALEADNAEAALCQIPVATVHDAGRSGGKG